MGIRIATPATCARSRPPNSNQPLRALTSLGLQKDMAKSKKLAFRKAIATIQSPKGTSASKRTTTNQKTWWLWVSELSLRVSQPPTSNLSFIQDAKTKSTETTPTQKYSAGDVTDTVSLALAWSMPSLPQRINSHSTTLTTLSQDFVYMESPSKWLPAEASTRHLWRIPTMSTQSAAIVADNLESEILQYNRRTLQYLLNS